MLTALTGALGIGLNSIWEARERSRALILGQSEHAHHDAAELRRQLAELMGRRNALMSCPYTSVERCDEHVAGERQAILQQSFTLNWSVPHAFGARREVAAAVADNAWMAVSSLRYEVQANDRANVRCLLGAGDDCDAVYGERARLARLENYCVVTLACMAAHRDFDLREQMIEQGMRARDQEIAERVRGPVVTDEFCAGVLQEREPVCSTRFDGGMPALAAAIDAARS